MPSSQPFIYCQHGLCRIKRKRVGSGQFEFGLSSENGESYYKKAQACDAPIAWDIRAKAISVGCKNVYPDEQLKIWVGGAMPEKFVQVIVAGGYVAKIEVKGGEKKIVGTVMLDIQTAKVDGLFMCPEFMGKRIGRELMHAVDRMAKQESLKRLSLESTLNAAPFYRACGYVGDTVTACSTKNERLHIDCIPMEKIIAP